MKELPLEYASEMNVLIAMEFEGGFFNPPPNLPLAGEE
jgi:hypothetical protein